MSQVFLSSRSAYVSSDDPSLTVKETAEIKSQERTIPEIVMPIRKFRQKTEMLYQHDCASAVVMATDGTEIMIAINGDFISIRRI